ncbi:MAG: SRPBCC family protein [Actinomycetota bacterium]|nr:SRPBCC family protein [Actinomycetota bacterium]
MDQISEPTAELHIDVDASPDDVWPVVADVTRIPEWSPVCHRCEWIDGSSGPAVGARFRGYNKLNGARWTRDCEVTALEPGQLFAFSTRFKGQESTRWRYRLEPTATGTRIHEGYEVVLIPRWIRFLRRLPGAMAKTERDTQENIGTSLQRLKAIVERRS